MMMIGLAVFVTNTSWVPTAKKCHQHFKLLQSYSPEPIFVINFTEAIYYGEIYV